MIGKVVGAIAGLVLGAQTAWAQIPAEWQGAAQAAVGEMERELPAASVRNWGPELNQGWHLARAWRQHNNGNIEIILAEYLTFTALCRRPGCAGSTVEGKGFVEVAQQVRNLRAQHGTPYALAQAAHDWLRTTGQTAGGRAAEDAGRNADLWAKDLDVPAADFATGNIYALAWLLARARPTPAEQVETFARFAIFVQGKAWIGGRCLDISKIAAVLDAPPRIDTCS
ncbi:MAG: hypothetical protein FJX02_00670 [Alphaproteobacteria bacterium]|nr:hypothetical protein [Alphaproteobacteria bacterium]